MKINLFTARLTELLNESNEKQKQICAHLNMTEKKLSKLKIGYNEPSIDDLILIAKYFNVSIDYLTGLTEDDTPHWNNENILTMHDAEQRGEPNEVSVRIAARQQGESRTIYVSQEEAEKRKQRLDEAADKIDDLPDV